MPAVALGVALQRVLTAAMRILARVLAARIAEQMREVQPIVGWVLGGVVVIAALPAAAALAMGILLQAAVVGTLGSGHADADEQSTGWRRPDEFAASLVGLESRGAWTWPVDGRLTTQYGGCNFAMCPHWGIDIAGAFGTRVVAAGDGVVAVLGWDPDGYGHYVILAHGDGWQTLYAHLQPSESSGPRLTLNDRVRRGDPIGGLGSSGASTGPHLHFEMWRDGRRIDPGLVLPS